MKRQVCTVMFVLLSANLALAQAAPSEDVRNEKKLRAICEQLDLTEQQEQQVEALLAKYRADLAAYKSDMESILRRVRDIYAEVEDARAAGDDERVRELQQQARDLAPSNQAQDEFFDSLQQFLSEPQKAQLAQLRTRGVLTKPSNMNPAHVLKAALSLDLATDQRAKLETSLAEFRSGSWERAEGRRLSSSDRAEKLITVISPLLTPEQETKFNELIADLRVDAPAPEARKMEPGQLSPTRGGATGPQMRPGTRGNRAPAEQRRVRQVKPD